MSVVDLHPEELLDKSERGELSDDERVRLDAHLARCAACRAEQVLRADFAAELDEDERPSAIFGLVQGALAAPRAQQSDVESESHNETSAITKVVAEPVRPGPENELAAIPGLRRRPRRTAVFLLVAAAVLAASAAGATGLTGRAWLHLRGASLETTHASATSLPTSAPLPVAAGPARAASLPALASAPPNTIDPSPPDSPADVAPAPVAVAPAFAPARAPAPALAPPPAPTSASALFDSANAARRAGDTATALARYDALETQFPGTREARVAKATTGRLLLDHGDAAGALARFDAYLGSGSSELREEAMAGRATALERLGRADEESRAWAALLATYPGTPYGAHARARVARSLPQ